jgi:hypothetical protein
MGVGNRADYLGVDAPTSSEYCSIGSRFSPLQCKIPMATHLVKRISLFSAPMGGLSLLWRETGARQPFSTLSGRSLVTYFQEHPEADCFIYQLVLRSTKDTPPSLFILIYGQPAHVESERRIVLWHELLGKRTHPAAPGSETAFRKSTRLPRYNTTSY